MTLVCLPEQKSPLGQNQNVFSSDVGADDLSNGKRVWVTLYDIYSLPPTIIFHLDRRKDGVTTNSDLFKTIYTEGTHAST